jgi:hypothetical protein
MRSKIVIRNHDIVRELCNTLHSFDKVLNTSAASIGIGTAFGATGSFGHELLRAGAHGLTQGGIYHLHKEATSGKAH